jgi:hypothetical protein
MYLGPLVASLVSASDACDAAIVAAETARIERVSDLMFIGLFLGCRRLKLECNGPISVTCLARFPAWSDFSEVITPANAQAGALIVKHRLLLLAFEEAGFTPAFLACD